MSDPVFTSRAEIEDWAVGVAREAGEASRWAGGHVVLLEAVETIRRVTLAHKHLMEDQPC